MAMECFIGVDVGTASVRSALFQKNGTLLAKAVKTINIHNPKVDYYEQSTDNIWAAIVTTVKEIVSCSQVEATNIKGIGFDATCSLAVLDSNGQPLSVSPTGKDEWNVIMWMDHRATDEATFINSTKHEVLNYVGGTISLEMQPPKLLWLKKNMANTWQKAAHFFDLPDFLTWKATGYTSRSLCSLVCKWTYFMADDISTTGSSKMGWNQDFLNMLGLQDLAENNFAKIGNEVKAPGKAVCLSGLSSCAAAELGLNEGTVVATSIIDAHAGGLGCLGCVPEGMKIPDIVNRMALISGTSNCHMAVSASPKFVPGVWGPYYSAMVPCLWSNEGGQSAAGKLLDHIVENHSAFVSLQQLAKDRHQHIFATLNEILQDLKIKQGLNSVASLTSNLHIWPDFHGNRSPLADPNLRGMISGLTLSSTIEDLAILYLATVQAIAYGTKLIVDALQKHGHSITVIFMCGGLRNNPLVVQTHADIVGLPFVLPDMEESVLLGAAILGAYASGTFTDIQSAMQAMGGKGEVIHPRKEDVIFHEKKYKVFLRMVQDQRVYQEIMTT